MNEPDKTEYFHTPSRKSILLSTVLAAVIAVILLFTVVLPVEYEIDPTGIGGALGLTAISTANTTGTPREATSLNAAGDDVSETGIKTYVVPDPWGPPQVTPGSEKYAQNSDSPFQSEVIEIPVQGDEELEYKFQMQEGQVLVYSWDSGNTDMYFEFHAEPTVGEYPEGYYMSYQIGDPSTGENGRLVAPFTGNHGWYFLNLTENPVTIKLQVSGYYQSHGRLH